MPKPQLLVCDGCSRSTTSTVPYKFGNYCYRCVRDFEEQEERKKRNR